MNRGLIFLLIFVFIFSNAFALVLESSDKVDFNGFNAELTVKISNDSNQAKRVKIEFLSPAEEKFEHLPLDLNAKETRTIKIKLTADENQNNTEYIGLLKIKLGEEEVKKQVKLVFQKTALKLVEQEKTETQTSEKKEEKTEKVEEESQLVGLASFVQTNVQTNLVLIELIIDAVLLVVAAVLLIMFISRFVKRIQVKK